MINLWLSLGYLFIPIFRHPHKRSQIQNRCTTSKAIWTCLVMHRNENHYLQLDLYMLYMSIRFPAFRFIGYLAIQDAWSQQYVHVHSGCWSQHFWIVIGLLDVLYHPQLGGPFVRSFGKTCSTAGAMVGSTEPNIKSFGRPTCFNLPLIPDVFTNFLTHKNRVKSRQSELSGLNTQSMAISGS